MSDNGRSGGTRLVADEHGSGRAVVMLHGQPGGRHDWDDVVALLADRFRLLVPDRLGYGRTGGAAAGFGANADAVVELLESRGVADAIVVGHSWGGGVALDLAIRHPERVAGLVLAASVGGEGSVSTSDRILGLPVVGDVLTLGGVVALGVRPLRRLFALWGAPTDHSAADRAPADGWWTSWRSFVAEQRALLAELPRVTAGLPTISAPTVVVIGEADRIVRPSSQEALASAVPGAEVVRVLRAGHLLPHERPDEVAAAVVRVDAVGRS